MPDTASQRFTYRIDRDDILVEVNDDWVEFARANWKPDFSAREVLGRLLWASVTDPATRQIHQLMARRVRRTGVELRVPFRCDSPHSRRFMELTLVPLEAGGLEFTGRILREEPQPAVALMRPDRPRSGELLAMCSWCKRIRAPRWALAEPWPGRAGTWWEVEELGSMLAGLHWEYLPEVTHTICQGCFEERMRELEGEEEALA